MASRQMSSPAHMSQMLLLLLCIFANTVAGLTQAYCSNENTALEAGDSYTYQSNGHCETMCQGYAFGIVQGLVCWCSNYAPANTVSVSNCDEQCPGYPYEDCGSDSKGLYGYVALGPSPSGTNTGGSSQASSTATTETVAGSVTTGSVTGSGSATPVVSTQVITQSGNTLIQTVTTMPTSASDLSQNKKSSSPGLIAGITIACIAALAFLAAAAFIFWRYHKRQLRLFVDAEGNLTTSGVGSPQRPMSVSTSSALMATAVGSAPPRINIAIEGEDSSSPASPVDRRGSQGGIYPYYHEQDSRLMPFNTHHNNDSRSSFNDGTDYSRRLEVKNPDPYDPDARSMND